MGSSDMISMRSNNNFTNETILFIDPLENLCKNNLTLYSCVSKIEAKSYSSNDQSKDGKHKHTNISSDHVDSSKISLSPNGRIREKLYDILLQNIESYQENPKHFPNEKLHMKMISRKNSLAEHSTFSFADGASVRLSEDSKKRGRLLMLD